MKIQLILVSLFLIYSVNNLLAPTSAYPAEGIAPGDDRGGVGAGGAVPTRYQVTARSKLSFSPWFESPYSYSILQLQIGDNPLSNLQVVSSLNTLSEASLRYHYNYQNCPSNYYPKLYLGTIQTISDRWLYDRQTYAGSDIKIPENWPLNNMQKGICTI